MMIGVGILFVIILWFVARRPPLVERENRRHSQPWWGQR